MKENGGPAFPKGGWSSETPGMTLRDYYAGQAMAGYLSNSSYMAALGKQCDHKPPEIARLLSVLCFLQADAMIAQRKVE